MGEKEGTMGEKGGTLVEVIGGTLEEVIGGTLEERGETLEAIEGNLEAIGGTLEGKGGTIGVRERNMEVKGGITEGRGKTLKAIVEMTDETLVEGETKSTEMIGELRRGLTQVTQMTIEAVERAITKEFMVPHIL